ncbi:MAG: lectin-like protein, partial [Planctomycetota bacterium]
MPFPASLIVLAPLVALAVPPISHQQQKLLPASGTQDAFFGRAVALHGQRALVGAPSTSATAAISGAAYLFDLGTGQQLAECVRTSGSPQDEFGRAVALEGTRAVVGASRADAAGADSGAAYLFDSATGQEIVKLLPADLAAGDSFGNAVAIADELVIVGAFESDATGLNSGAAYVFSRDDGTEMMKLQTGLAQPFDYMGSAVDVSGNRAILGAWGNDWNGFSSGAAFIFDLDTGWMMRWLRDDVGGVDFDRFGSAVAIDGDLAVVGAPGDGTNGSESGSAFVFDVESGALLRVLLPDDGFSFDRFGSSISMSGSTVVIGAPGNDDQGSNAGAAYVFDVESGEQLAKIFAFDGAGGDLFGTAVGLDRQRAVVGSWGDDDNGSYSGSAYVMNVGPTWSESPAGGRWFSALPARSWEDAENQAQQLGGHLATVRSPLENDWYTSTFAVPLGASRAPWIGYSDAQVEGLFTWSSAEPASFESWAVGEPDNGQGADWAVLGPDGTWADEPQTPARPGIVEVEGADCDLNGLPDRYEMALLPDLDINGDGVLDACVSASYCTATPNSSGLPARVVAAGSPLLSDNSLTLRALNLPAHQLGYFLMSQSQGFVPGFGGSSGNLCLGGQIQRLSNPLQGGRVLQASASGEAIFTLDLEVLAVSVGVAAGDTWNFQLWFRDVMTSNTTNGVSVTLR